MSSYLSICAIYRDEADYLREWIEFHRLVGVEQFFLYDNCSEDAHEEVLTPYVDAGIVSVRRWPEFPGQKSAYEHCLAEHRDDSRWIAFIDLDEFLFSPAGRALSDVLVEFEPWPGVGAHWAVFGSSGHHTKPPGLVIENYLHRSDYWGHNRWIKSIVDPARTVACRTSHAFAYSSGFAVDENKNLINGPRFSWTQSVSFSHLRVNHYLTKSDEEWRRRAEHPWPNRAGARREGTGAEGPGELLSVEFDDSIQMYVPALRKALSGRLRPLV